MNKLNFIDFITNTNKINNTKLGKFLCDLSEGSIRNLKTKYSKRYEAYYLGALCIANDIKKEDLQKIVINKTTDNEENENISNVVEKVLLEKGVII